MAGSFPLKIVTFQFHGNLNDFLKRENRNKPITYQFGYKQNIKDACEALGVPHCEIFEVHLNNTFAVLENHLSNGATIDVYPRGFLKNQNKLTGKSLQDNFHPDQGFIIDVHLGKLAKLMRSLGLNVLYDKNIKSSEIGVLSTQTKRMLLTGDIALLKRRIIRRGYYIRSKKPEEQLKEVVHRFAKNYSFSLFSRCLLCNEPVVKIEKEDILHRLLPNTKKYFDIFYYCHNCDKIYWRGSHYEKMKNLLDRVISSENRFGESIWPR